MDVQRGQGARIDTRVGLRLVEQLLEDHAGAAIAVVDITSNLGDARAVLAAAGIDIGAHDVLRGTVAAELVLPTDAWLVSDAFADAGSHGTGMRFVRLKDGREATLHIIAVDDPLVAYGFVLVIVPDSDGTFAAAPAPAVAAARVGVVYIDGPGVVTRAEDSALSVLGRDRADVEGHPVISLAHPDDQESCISHWVAAKEQRGIAHRRRCRVIRGDGSVLWTELTLTNRIDAAGRGDVCAEMVDISREVAAAESLADERSLLKELTESLPVGVAKFDAEGRIEYSNARLADLLGCDPAAVIAEAIAGRDPRLANAFSQLLDTGKSARFVTERQGDERRRDLEWTLRPVAADDGGVAGGVLCIADVTEATGLRAALEERATTDALTGCFNWAGTIECLQSALAAAVPTSGVGLLFIDLDGFKSVNDGHGHAVGDRVLEVVARRLRNAVRPPDHIGRLGGDEFVVVAPGLPSLASTHTLAERVSAEVNGAATIAGLRVEVSASIGVAWADSGDADALLAEADSAMYLVKCAAPAVPAS